MSRIGLRLLTGRSETRVGNRKPRRDYEHRVEASAVPRSKEHAGDAGFDWQVGHLATDRRELS